MKINHLAALFASSCFFAPDAGGATGAGATEPATLADARTQLATARTELAAARRALVAAETARDAANSRVTLAEAGQANLQAQFDSATLAATTARGELDAARVSFARVSGELTTAQTSLSAELANRTRLESLCGVHGIAHTQAVAAGVQSPEKKIMPRADFEKLDDAAKETFMAAGGKLTD